MTKIILELAKARLSALVLLTTWTGFVLAGSSAAPSWTLLWTLAGTGLAAGGANALNQWRERRHDALMERTRGRPLPSGRITPGRALAFGLGASAAGIAVLAALVGPLPATLAASVVLLYVLVYTPLKRRSTLCTLVGAVCGALPPLIGWAGAAGRLDVGAWLLGATLFLWQIPHFFALAWLYRRDYERGGFRMLPVVDRGGRTTCTSLVMFGLALLPLGFTIYLAGVAGPAFAIGSLLLGAGWLLLDLRLYQDRSDRNARRVFYGSLVYLPLLLGLMVVDRAPRVPGPVPTLLAARSVSPGGTAAAGLDAALDVAVPEPR